MVLSQCHQSPKTIEIIPKMEQMAYGKIKFKKSGGLRQEWNQRNLFPGVLGDYLERKLI